MVLGFKASTAFCGLYSSFGIGLPGALFPEELALEFLLLKVDSFSVDCILLGQMRVRYLL